MQYALILGKIRERKADIGFTEIEYPCTHILIGVKRSQFLSLKPHMRLFLTFHKNVLLVTSLEGEAQDEVI